MNKQKDKEKHTKEIEMRNAKVPRPKTEKELNKYIKSLVDMEHDYGTCVYAMSMAATASFYYVSHKLGVTGFQASCADLDFIRRTRSIEAPFMIITLQDYLYPQYNLRERVDEMVKNNKKWINEEAKKLLEQSGNCAAPEVIEHWKSLL